MNACNGPCQQGRKECPAPWACQLPESEDNLTLVSKVILYAILFFVIGGMFATVLWQVANLPGVL